MKNNYQKTSNTRSKKQVSFYVMLFVILLMSTTLLKAQVPSYVPSNGLIGWWPFNGNANDESGNGNNGIVNGATLTNDRFGNNNKAYSFDGLGNFIEIADNTSLDLTNDLTISCWFNPSNLGIVNMIISKHNVSLGSNAGTFAMGLWENQNNNLINFQASPNFNTSTYPSTLGAVTLNSWRNFTVVYIKSSGILTYYLDGNAVFSTIIIFNIQNTNEPVRIGANFGGNLIDFFSGELDDIGIWNRALIQQEITALYNGCQLSINTQPANQNITVNNNAQFTVSSSDPNATYQWQTDLGVGFQNLSSVGQYSGANNDTLTVSYVTFANNNQPFRCIVTSGSCSDTSNVAVLTVNNNVGVVELAANNSFSIYPNPTINNLHLKASNDLMGTSYSIYDNVGHLLLTGKIISTDMNIDVTALSSGNYFFSITNSKKEAFKIIK